MKAVVTDKAALAALSPLNVTGYLRAKGWTRYSETPGTYSVWINEADTDAQIIIPQRQASDFVALLGQMLSELEAFEGRSQLDIIRDLLNSGFDVVRLAARSPAAAGGSVRIDEGLALFEQAREMLLSAACATIKPRPVFHSRKPQQANEYMKAARLGQTEHGSYVLTMLSPVAPSLSEQADIFGHEQQPFERRVVETLSRSVGLTVGAAIEASATGSFDPFKNAVSGGVSANLCEAVTRLFDIGEATEIDVAVSWALVRPTPDNAPSYVSIVRDFVPPIKEAARLFRAFDTFENYVVQGPVVKLERDEGAPQGRVTIYAPIEDAMRKIIVTLEPEEYDKATAAHRDYRHVKVQGDVVRDGRAFKITKPVGFSLTTDEEEPDLLSAPSS